MTLACLTTGTNEKMNRVLRIFLSFFIVGAFVGSEASSFDAPRLTPSDEVTLEEGSELLLRCEHNYKEGVEWIVPNERINETYEVVAEQQQEQPYRYISKLSKDEPNYEDVGYYTCIKKGVRNNNEHLEPFLEEKLASRVYVYVNDPGYSLVEPFNVVLVVPENEPLIVPCKPTTKDVDVILSMNYNEMSSSSYKDYDPRTGFKVYNIRRKEDVISTTCTAVHPLEDDRPIRFRDFRFKANTKQIHKPTITSPQQGHGWVDDVFKLICEVKVDIDGKFVLNWIPAQTDEQRIVKGDTLEIKEKRTQFNRTYRSVLSVHGAKKIDSGDYECIVTDMNGRSESTKYHVIVLEQDEAYINLTAVSNHVNYSEIANRDVKMVAECKSFPIADLTWWRNGNQILNTTKHRIESNNHTLKIYGAELADSGDYQVRANNGKDEKVLTLNVRIKDKPQVNMNDVHVSINEPAQITCRVRAYPEPNVTWTFVSCSRKPKWPKCNEGSKESFTNSSVSPGSYSYELVHKLEYWPKSAGRFTCTAKNGYGEDRAEAYILLNDIEADKNVTIKTYRNNRQKIAKGDEVKITCAALAYHYEPKLEWFKRNVHESTDLYKIKSEKNVIEIISENTDYSYRETLKFCNISMEDGGEYVCRAKRNDKTTTDDAIAIEVNEPSEPEIISIKSTNVNRGASELEVELLCQVKALPLAIIEWYKDDIKLTPHDNITITEKNISEVENLSTLKINPFSHEYEGEYECRAGNLLRTAIAQIEIPVDASWDPIWIVAIVFFFIVLIALVIFLLIRVNRERKLVRELKKAGLHNFMEGDPSQINHALNLDEQADLLPYDTFFEFPRNKLELGKQLGAGAFGVVHRAIATDIKPEEEKSVVAVKMVKRTADNEAMHALVSELKILIHLGKHLNVVNLLGAVTKNVKNRELMVIVEYCRYGNVQNFLMQNRKQFINQISSVTGKIDPSIMTQRFSDQFETSRYSDSSDPRSGTRAGRPNSNNDGHRSDSYEIQIDSCATNQTVMTTIPEDECNLLSNNTTAAPWRSNYKTDTSEIIAVTTSDLVSWAFQVARGMDYLSSKKVLHGDLAARNILLCDNNIVKICDFGLARSMIKSEIYQKMGEAPLPIKWLALESFSDRVFSTYTDVWSFGIVLWEFFSLAKVPYPGIKANIDLYEQLKKGYRMERPPYANDDLYDIMLECWSTNPESRPLFNELENKFARLLGDEVTNHYVDMNEPYMRANNEYFKRKGGDMRANNEYFKRKGGDGIDAPPEDAPPPPIDTNSLPEIHATQYSPTRSNLDRSSASPQKYHNKQVMDANQRQPEEIPMLQKGNYADDDDEAAEEHKHDSTYITPKPLPRHHIRETPLNGTNELYVNVTTPKKIASKIKSADAFANPGYDILKIDGK